MAARERPSASEILRPRPRDRTRSVRLFLKRLSPHLLGDARYADLPGDALSRTFYRKISLVSLTVLVCLLPFAPFRGLEREADSAPREHTLEDYRHFRIEVIDLLGRMPTRDEVAQFERADFDENKFIQDHLQGPGYTERLTRIYMDLLRLEPNLNFATSPAQLYRHEIQGPDGKLEWIYYREGQRRTRLATDGEFCLTPEETGLNIRARANQTEGTAKKVTKKLLDQYTVSVKPWWIYKDYDSANPQARFGASWNDADAEYRPSETLLTNPDGKPTTEIRVCREEAQEADTGHIYASGLVKQPGPAGKPMGPNAASAATAGPSAASPATLRTANANAKPNANANPAAPANANTKPIANANGSSVAPNTSGKPANGAAGQPMGLGALGALANKLPANVPMGLGSLAALGAPPQRPLPASSLAGGRTRPYVLDNGYATAHKNESVACSSKLALTSSIDCGCGKGLSRCVPGDNDQTPNAFYFPNHAPLGPGEPIDNAKQQAQRWFPHWWSRESVHFIEDIFESDRDFREILTGRHTFVNGPLAQFYRSVQRGNCCGPETNFGMIEETEPLFDPKNVPADLRPHDTGKWVLVPDRGPHAAGLLTTPMFLEKYASARARGALLYNAFLCKSFLADNATQLTPSAEPNLTIRPGCSTCHATLEPLAAYFSRIEPNSFVFLPQAEFPAKNPACKKDKNGKLNGPCNALYDLAFSDGSGTELRSAYASPAHADATVTGAAQDVVKSPEFARCAVDRVTSSFLGRPMTPDDETLLSDLTSQFTKGGFKMRGLVQAIMKSPAYHSSNNMSGDAWRGTSAGTTPPVQNVHGVTE